MRKDIKVTDDYSIFKKIKGNRRLINGHVNNLAEVFEKDSQILQYNPMIVNDQLEIIDGQHRLAAAKKVGIPVYYIIHKGLSLKDVQSLNSNTRQWTPLDYAKSYAELGNLNYQIYLDFAANYPFNHDLLRPILAGGTCNQRQFKQGDFHIKEIKRATQILDQLMDFAPFHTNYANRAFVAAFIKLFNNGNYNHNVMMKKMQGNHAILNKHSDPVDYQRELETIYNAGNRADNRIRFF